MYDFSGPFFFVLFILSLIYIFRLHSRFEKAENEAEFDNRVLGFVDGLYFAEIRFGCSNSEMRRYVKTQLSIAHQLPGNQFLIEYTTANGWQYCSHTGNGDHYLFAILCIAQYAKDHDNTALVSWCESMMNLASKSGINY